MNSEKYYRKPSQMESTSSDESRDRDLLISRTPRQSCDYPESVLSRSSAISGQLPLTLTWHNLNVYAKPEKPNALLGMGKTARTEEVVSESGKGKQILKGVSGIAKPGQLIAVMGASGAGKSTLINTLTGRNSSGVIIEGDGVCVNGYDIGRDITTVSAYVQQNDLFYGAFTVREHLIFQAMLRLPSDMSRADKIKRVDEVIMDLGLQKCANTSIGIPGMLKGISGGEKKRLAFASEVITNPSLLFCDEPTTGLDSFMAEEIVKVLQKLAARGKTIMCTIHQPASEIFMMFDTLLLIADGRVAYMGDSEGALKLFENINAPCPLDYNPADYFIEKLSIKDGDTESHHVVMEICDRFADGEIAKQIEDDIEKEMVRDGTPLFTTDTSKSPYKAHFLIQFILLLWRGLIGNFRNKRVAIVRFIQKAVMGVFAGLLYWHVAYNQAGVQNFNGMFFYFLSTMSYPTLFGVIDTVHKEFPIIVREHHSGMYTVAGYYVGRVISYLPVHPTDGLIMTVICYWMINPSGTFVSFLGFSLVVIAVEIVAVSVGLMFSCVSPSYPIAIAASAPITTIISLTGGLYANVGSLPAWLSWAQWGSYFRYGFEAFLINQWVPVTEIECGDKNSTGSCHYNNGKDVLDSLNFSDSFTTYWRNIGALFLMAFVCHTIAYIGLAIRVRRAR